MNIEPIEVEEWLTTLKKEQELENPPLDRMRRVMSMVYRHGQRYSLIYEQAWFARHFELRKPSRSETMDVCVLFSRYAASSTMSRWS